MESKDYTMGLRKSLEGETDTPSEDERLAAIEAKLGDFDPDIDKGYGSYIQFLELWMGMYPGWGEGWTAKSVKERFDEMDAEAAIPSRAEKNIAIEMGVDDVYETLTNKHLVNPYIGGASPAAMLLVHLDPSLYIKVWYREYGAGTSSTMEIVQATEPDAKLLVEVDSAAILVTLGADSDGEPVVCTAAQLKAALEAVPEFNSLFRVQRLPDEAVNYAVLPMEETNFAIAEDAGSRLQSTAVELDEAVAQQHRALAGPVSIAAAAYGSLSLSGNVTDGDSVNIGNFIYVFKDALTTEPATIPNEVLKGATASDTLDNLYAAIKGADGIGTLFSTGTLGNTAVTSAPADGDVLTITAVVKGVSGNSIPAAKVVDAGAVMTFSGTTLGSGVDGTPALAGTIVYEASKQWIATTECTVSDSSGWKYISYTG